MGKKKKEEYSFDFTVTIDVDAYEPWEAKEKAIEKLEEMYAECGSEIFNIFDPYTGKEV